MWRKSTATRERESGKMEERKRTRNPTVAKEPSESCCMRRKEGAEKYESTIDDSTSMMMVVGEGIPP